MRTIHAVFDGVDDANRALKDLSGAGMPIERVGLLARSPTGDGALTAVEVPGLGRVSANPAMRDMLANTGQGGMREALSRLGIPAEDTARYAEAIEHGGVLEAVVVEDNYAGAARSILGRHEHASADVGDIVVPVIREELRVGAREVDAGGVRVSSHVRFVPVEQTVTIREERVTVERRVIDRPIEGDDAFRDRTVDLKLHSEEPVIAKRAHVVEEIRVHKDRDERTQTIRDTLRHTDVSVSQLPAEPGFDSNRYAEHFRKTYGDRYDITAIAPAYEFGERLSREGRGPDFSNIEADAKARWEQHHPGTWNKVRDAIMEGWQKVRH
jgi:uncharacterized protein (TIGR02271 family)